MERTNYTKETYGWGDVRILRKGASYTCIIHPEHMNAICRQEAFTDEQGMRWHPTIADGIVTLRHDNYNFSLPLEELVA